MVTLLQGQYGGGMKESDIHCKAFVRGSSNCFQNHWFRKDHSVPKCPKTALWVKGSYLENESVLRCDLATWVSPLNVAHVGTVLLNLQN